VPERAALMQILFACLADHASTDANGGKLNVMGIFDTVRAQTFPATHPRMVLALRFLTEHEDNNRKGDIVISVRDEDRDIIPPLRAAYEPGSTPPGGFATSNLLVELNGLVFARPGRYHVAVQIGKHEEIRVPLQVTQI
jgi:hypothetical protein